MSDTDLLTLRELRIPWSTDLGRTLQADTIALRAGDVLQIAGASGSGKSLLLRCLAGLVSGAFTSMVADR